METRIVVTGILKDNDLFLIVKRNENDDLYPGAWEFPGGHLEENEELTDCLHRELLEETGMDIDVSRLKPFMLLEHLNKDYPEAGSNRLTKIYYFSVTTSENVDLSKTNYTLEETIGNYELRYIPLEIVEELLLKNAEVAPKNKVIATEMLEAIKEYKRITSIEKI